MKTRAQGATKSRRGGSISAKRRSTSLRSGTRNRSSKGRRSTARAQGSKTGARSRKTQDHEQIRQWVEARGGHPAIVAGTTRGKQGGGVLRIDFPGYSGEGSLKPVSWDEWFQIFDERGVEFLYQDKTAGGKQSRFNKLVCP